MSGGGNDSEMKSPIGVIGSGQTGCWDSDGAPVDCAGTGQDGELRPGMAWPKPRFDHRGPVVVDLLTGLTWLRDANIFEWPLDWETAHEAIADLAAEEHSGYDDWRLPARRDLWSLVSFASAKPALPEGHPFRNVFLGWYWTANTAARNPDYAWAVHITGGRVFFEAKERYALTWPCRGANRLTTGFAEDGAHRQSDHRFTADGSEVLDRATGLRWTRKADLCNGPVGWDEALRAVRDLNKTPGSATGWRLPSITELESLLDFTRSDPAFQSDHPFAGIGHGYWSSTSSAFETDWAMVLHLSRGAIGVGIKRDPRYLVWPVSGPRGADS